MQMRNRGVRSRAEAYSHDERMARLALVRDTYGAPQLLTRARRVLPAAAGRASRGPPCARAAVGRPSASRPSWESAFEPFAPGRPRRLPRARRQPHRVRSPLRPAAARRPAAILVHGYMTGQWAVEERAWPIRWLNQRGLDVALAVLPFHGVRARAEGGAPPFPGADPRFTNEGFRQAVADLRVSSRCSRARGATSVGLMGMSLGGYTTALMATVEPDLAFAVPLIPLASLADFARDQGRLGAGPNARVQHAALEAANHVVSPLARPSRCRGARARRRRRGRPGDARSRTPSGRRAPGAPLLRVRGGTSCRCGGARRSAR